MKEHKYKGETFRLDASERGYIAVTCKYSERVRGGAAAAWERNVLLVFNRVCPKCSGGLQCPERRRVKHVRTNFVSDRLF